MRVPPTTGPSDADGDALQPLEQSGFDFSKSTLIDGNVDFQSWPPPAAAIAALSRHYPSVRAYEPVGEFAAYLQFQVFARVTDELVTDIQQEIADLMSPYDGECSSWGVILSPGEPSEPRALWSGGGSGQTGARDGWPGADSKGRTAPNSSRKASGNRAKSLF